MKKQVQEETRRTFFPRWKQWKQLPTILTKTEQYFLKGAFSVALVSLFFLFLGFFLTHGTQIPSSGGVYTEGLIGTPHLINPLFAVSDVDQDLVKLIYSGLFRWDPELGIIPDLASSYTLSPDGKIYTITLQKNIFWHHGVPILARDVVFTFKRLQDRAYQSPFFSRYQGIQVTEKDASTIIFTLEKPSKNFLSLLTIGILCADLWQPIMPQNILLTSLNREPVGCGPFKFEKLEIDKHGSVRSYTLTAFEKFHRSTPLIKQLFFKFYTDQSTAIQALKDKRIEGLGFIPSEYIPEFEKEGLKIYYPQNATLTVLFFNTQKSSLKEIKIRQAWQNQIQKNLLEHPLSSPVLQTLPVNFFPGLPIKETVPVSQNENSSSLETAIKEAKISLPISFTITVPDQPTLLSLAQQIKESCETANISITIQKATPVDLEEEILRTKSYDMLLTNIQMAKEVNPFLLWHSSQITYPGLNFSQWKNEKVDSTIEQLQTTQDPSKELESLTTIETILNEETPAIFLLKSFSPYVLNKRIKNVFLPSILLPSDRFSRIESWYIKTKKVF